MLRRCRQLSWDAMYCSYTAALPGHACLYSQLLCFPAGDWRVGHFGILYFRMAALWIKC